MAKTTNSTLEQKRLMGEALAVAYAADEAFAAAVAAAGYKSRWGWNQHIDPGPEALRAAYRDKVTADNRVHALFLAQREGR